MLDYESAGVSISQGNKLVEKIKPLSQKTQRKEVLAGIGGFGSAFALDTSKYQQPVLVSATDGVGTKLLLANQLQKHDTIGIDLVAMCVNDLITMGAEPLFFLDYFATGLLSVNTAHSVISGIAEGCLQAGASLVGGETAEMPGMYSGEDYDLAGFCVGVVEKSQIIDKSNVSAGDKLIAIASSGPHANGYSLIRKILGNKNIKLQTSFGQSEQTIGEVLITPTLIYVNAIQQLLGKVAVKSIAHITGGGLLENIPRMLSDNTRATLHEQCWEWPEIFKWLQIQGNIATGEMYRTFNCGVGMVVCVAEDQADQSVSILKQSGHNAWLIGDVEPKSNDQPRVDFLK